MYRTAMLLLATVLFGSGCQSLQDVIAGADRPSASIAGTALSAIDLDGMSLDFDVNVKNPYAVPLPLANLSYDLASGGTPFLKGSAPLTGTIPAGGSRTITLPAQVSFADLFSALSGVRPGDVIPYDAGLTLAVDAPGIGPIELPLRDRGDLPVPAAPKVKLAGLQWDEITLSSATALLRLDVENTNRFKLYLNELETSLQLAGRNVGNVTARDALDLAAGQSGTLEVPISFSPVDLGVGVFNLLRGNAADYAIEGAIGGTTAFGPMRLPFGNAGRTPLTGG